MIQDYRREIKTVLEEIECDIDFKVKMAFPESVNDGNIVSYFELSNISTDVSVIDDISFQIDLWFFDLKALLSVLSLVDTAMTDKGFLRQFVSPDSMLHDPSGYLRKTLRYGRRVETLTNRLID